MKLFSSLFEPGHGKGPSSKETLLTAASLVTTIRLVLTLYFVVVALQTKEIQPIVFALLAYWIGDVIDGMVARATNRETQLGAVYDIAADRLSVVTIYMLFALLLPEMTVPIMIFMVAFVVVDTILSVSFLKYNLLSINYFYLVDKKLYDLNWSTLAKTLTTSGFMLVTLVLQSVPLSVLVALVVLGLKLYSLRRLESLRVKAF